MLATFDWNNPILLLVVVPVVSVATLAASKLLRRFSTTETSTHPVWAAVAQSFAEAIDENKDRDAILASATANAKDKGVVGGKIVADHVESLMKVVAGPAPDPTP